MSSVNFQSRTASRLGRTLLAGDAPGYLHHSLVTNGQLSLFIGKNVSPKSFLGSDSTVLVNTARNAFDAGSVIIFANESINGLTQGEIGIFVTAPGAVLQGDTYTGTLALKVATTGAITVQDLDVQDLVVNGDLTVSGTTTTINTQTVTIEDNILLINSNQTGTPLTSLTSGIEVERGDSTNYQFLFRESDDTFVIGEAGSLQAVATREDSPTANGIAYWDSASVMFKTSTYLEWDGTNFILSGLGSRATDFKITHNDGVTISVPNSSYSTGDSINITAGSGVGAGVGTGGSIILTSGAGPASIGSSPGNIQLVTSSAWSGVGGIYLRPNGVTELTVLSTGVAVETALTVGGDNVATREVTPTNLGVAVWDSGTSRFITDSELLFNGTTLSTANISIDGQFDITTAGGVPHATFSLDGANWLQIDSNGILLDGSVTFTGADKTIKLEQPTSGAGSDLTLEAGTAGTGAGSADGGDLYLVAGQRYLTMSFNGKVFVQASGGTIATFAGADAGATYNFDLTGSGRFTSNVTTDAVIYGKTYAEIGTAGASGTYGILYWPRTAGQSVFWESNGNNVFQIGTGTTIGSSSILTITAGGNLLLGTTTDFAKAGIVTASSDGDITAWGAGQFVVSPGGTTTSLGLGISANTSSNYTVITSATPNTAWRDLYFRANDYLFHNGTNLLAKIDTSKNFILGASSATFLWSGSETGISVNSSGTNASGVSVKSSNTEATTGELVASYSSNVVALLAKGSTTYPTISIQVVQNTTYTEVAQFDSTGMIVEDIKRHACGSIHSTTVQQDTIFDALDPYIPSTNDECPVSGSLSVGGSGNRNISKAVRTGASTIDLYTMDDGAYTLGTITVTNGNTSTYHSVSIAW